MQFQPVAALSFAALLVACGGSGSSGNAALTKTFNYGSPQTPSALEQSAVTAAESDLSDAVSMNSAPDATKGLAVVAFADTVAALALGGTGIAVVSTPPSSEMRAAVQAADTSTCATQTGNSITFKNCSVSDTGFDYTLNGSISWTATTVTWDITGSFAGTQNGESFNFTLHQAGTLTVTSNKITGNSTSEFSGSVSGQGQTVNFGVATAAVLDVTYQTTPSYCVTSGSLEVKRVWTQKPQGASSSAFADAAVKITWTGCNVFQVAHST